MEEILIRECTTNDFDSVFELLKQLWPDMLLDYDALQMIYKNALESDKQRFIVALIDNRIIGFCSLTIKNNIWVAGNLGHIDELVVDKKYRRQGVGRELMNEITHIAKENICKRIELDSAFHRKEAHLFYENSGYENRAYLFSKEI